MSHNAPTDYTPAPDFEFEHHRTRTMFVHLEIVECDGKYRVAVVDLNTGGEKFSMGGLAPEAVARQAAMAGHIWAALAVERREEDRRKEREREQAARAARLSA